MFLIYQFLTKHRRIIFVMHGGQCLQFFIISVKHFIMFFFMGISQIQIIVIDYFTKIVLKVKT